ncbi:MAG: S41 family peptidase [Proteobacteria bacterium]|nr:S41 family peptidase [Pseudomonadota bacterium]
MRDSHKIGNRLLLAMLTVAVMLLGATVLAPYSLAHPALEVAQGNGANFKYIQRALYLLKDQYVEKPDFNALLKSAGQGVKVYLKEQKLSFPALDKFPTSPSADANLETLVGYMQKISADNKGKVNEQKLLYYALKGLMFGLKDPYSVALEPKEFKHLKESMSGGNFGGVGIYIELDRHHKNQLMVVEPIDDTPAAKAGLRPGDWILNINKVSTKGIDLEVAANRIRGPVGTPVVLEIQPKGKGPTHNVTMTRSLIHVKSATGKMLPNQIGYIRLRFFGEDTGEEVEQALTALEGKGMKGLILDVRNNGGGYINAAQQTCSQFLPRGQVVVSVVGRKRDTETNRSSGSNHKNVPMVVLINGFSASASEITAGALQDTHVATLIGTKSFGKGTVQTLQDLPDGGSLKFTIAHYLTPAGRNINKKGIKPDIEVKMDAAKVGQATGDTQLQAAEKFLKGKTAGH